MPASLEDIKEEMKRLGVLTKGLKLVEGKTAIYIMNTFYNENIPFEIRDNKAYKAKKCGITTILDLNEIYEDRMIKVLGVSNSGAGEHAIYYAQYLLNGVRSEDLNVDKVFERYGELRVQKGTKIKFIHGIA